MPLTWSSQQSPRGRTYVRTLSAGAVTDPDARHFGRRIAPGQPHHGHSVLAVIEPGTDFSPEARKSFMGMASVGAQHTVNVAVVVTSAPLRVLASFVIRMSGASTNTRFFENEASATRWLHQHVDS